MNAKAVQTTHHSLIERSFSNRAGFLPPRLLSTEKVLSAGHPQSAGIAASGLLRHKGHHRQHAFAHVRHGVCMCEDVFAYEMGARAHSS